MPGADQEPSQQCRVDKLEVLQFLELGEEHRVLLPCFLCAGACEKEVPFIVNFLQRAAVADPETSEHVPPPVAESCVLFGGGRESCPVQGCCPILLHLHRVRWNLRQGSLPGEHQCRKSHHLSAGRRCGIALVDM